MPCICRLRGGLNSRLRTQRPPVQLMMSQPAMSDSIAAPWAPPAPGAPNFPVLVLVAALGRNRVIGRDNQLLWHLPGDLPRFKALTMGHALLMGRKTHVSIGRVLPGRENWVLTRQPQHLLPGARAISSLAELQTWPKQAPVMVVGGGEIYALTLPWAQRLELTEVDDAPAGDTYFPPLDAEQWQRTVLEQHPAQGNTPAFAYVRYQRRTPIGAEMAGGALACP